MKSTLKPDYSKVLRLAPDKAGTLHFEVLNCGISEKLNSDSYQKNLISLFTQKDLSEAEKLWQERRWYYALGLMQASNSYIGAKDTEKSFDWKNYFNKLDHARRVVLSPTGSLDASSITTATVNRRTWRAFSRNSCSFEKLSIILTELNNGIDGLPSFQSVFLTHVVVFQVDGLSPGIYVYHPDNLSLICTHNGDFSNEICQLLRGLVAPKTAAFTLILSADMGGLPKAYGSNSSIRKMFVHAGFALQRSIEVCTVLNLGALPTPAMPDTDCSALLDVSGICLNPVYSLTVGTTT